MACIFSGETRIVLLEQFTCTAQSSFLRRARAPWAIGKVTVQCMGLRRPPGQVPLQWMALLGPLVRWSSTVGSTVSLECMARYAPWCPRDQPSLSSSSLSSPPPLQCKYRSTEVQNCLPTTESKYSFLISPLTTLIVCLLKFPIRIEI